MNSKAKQPMKHMKQTTLSYYKNTKLETDTTAYRNALHAVIEQFRDLQHFTEEHIIEQRRAILNNQLSEPILETGTPRCVSRPTQTIIKCIS